jgi:hypothetical protein
MPWVMVPMGLSNLASINRREPNLQVGVSVAESYKFTMRKCGTAA